MSDITTQLAGMKIADSKQQSIPAAATTNHAPLPPTSSKSGLPCAKDCDSRSGNAANDAASTPEAPRDSLQPIQVPVSLQMNVPQISTEDFIKKMDDLCGTLQHWTAEGSRSGPSVNNQPNPVLSALRSRKRRDAMDTDSGRSVAGIKRTKKR